MSREIDPEDIASGNLSVDEVLYLQDRNILPDHITPLEIRYSSGEGVVDPEDESDDSDEGDEGTEDYGKGWNNEARRAELAERGLSVDGKSAELVARLIRSDNDELEEGDAAPSDDESEEDSEDTEE